MIIKYTNNLSASQAFCDRDGKIASIKPDGFFGEELKALCRGIKVSNIGLVVIDITYPRQRYLK